MFRQRPGFEPTALLAALSLAGAMAVPVLSFVCLFPLVPDLPTWDQWSLIPLWQAHFAGDPVSPLLFEPYNGHLNFLPRLVFYGLGVLSGWDVRLEVVLSYLAACGTLALLLALLARHGRTGWMLALPVSAQVFSFLQYENFLSGYPFGQNLSQLMTTATIFLISGPRLGTARLLGAGAASAAATFSWGAGLAAWYVGLGGLLLRRPRKLVQLGPWLGCSLAMTLAVKLGAGGSFGAIPWGRVPSFFLAVLGKAWSPLGTPTVELAIALGAGALLLFAALAIWAHARSDQRALAWILLGLSALTSAGLIAMGRSATGTSQALVSHYVTATYPLVVSCTILGFLLLLGYGARHRRLRPWLLAMALGGAGVITLQPVALSFELLPVLRGWSSIIDQHSLAIARGTASDAQIKTSHHPVPGLVRSGTEVLRDHRLAWFRRLLDGAAPAGNVDRLAGATTDEASLEVPVDEPWMIEGWAVRSRRQGGPVKAIHLLVDGRRIASAALDLPRSDVAHFFGSQRFLYSGWVLSVPSGAVSEGRHHVMVAAASFNGSLYPLLESELVGRAGVASAGL